MILFNAKMPEFVCTAASKGHTFSLWKNIEMTKLLKIGHLFFAALALPSVLALPANAETFKSEYVVSLFGLSVAKSSFTTQLDAKAYAISGTLKSAGLAELFDDTQGTITASGSFGKTNLQPGAYAVNYTSGKKKKRTALGFAKGGVVSVENSPELKKRDPWIEVQPEHLRAAFDPLSAFMVRAASLDSVCNNTLRIFDGEVRADLKLAPAGATTVKTAGYSGPAMTCSIRMVPISGYRKGKKQIEYLRKNTNMSVTFIPIGSTGLYAPALAKVGTQVGTVTIRAKRLEAVQ
jgi:Protein of unknown function (DUF3108)